jgi:hypothetical protein
MVTCPAAGLHNFTLIADVGNLINEWRVWG